MAAPKEPLEVVDCHHHVWEHDALCYGWLAKSHPLLGDLAPIRPSYRLRDFLAEGAAVGVHHVKSIHVEAGADHSLEETRFLGPHFAASRAGAPLVSLNAARALINLVGNRLLICAHHLTRH